MSQGNVADLIRKLRKMHGHLSAKDRAVVVEAIGALSDLAHRLHDATHTSGLVLKQLADESDGPPREASSR
jgi:hypothetical protein